MPNLDLRPYHEIEAWLHKHIAGAFSVFDMAALKTGTDRLKPGDVYVEVGTQHGRSAYCANKFLAKGVGITCVDINDAPKGPDTMSRKDFFNEYLPSVGFIHKASEVAAASWTVPIDMMFIDADHSYEGVKLDLESWYPHMKSGGYMYFHDADDSSPGVAQLLKELGKDKRFTDITYYKHLHDNNTSVASVRIA